MSRNNSDTYYILLYTIYTCGGGGIRRRRGASPMAPRKQKQKRITSVLLPELKLKHPMSVPSVVANASVQGSAWSGRLTAAESATLYNKCTVLDRTIAHRFTPAGPPQEAWKWLGYNINYY